MSIYKKNADGNKNNKDLQLSACIIAIYLLGKDTI